VPTDRRVTDPRLISDALGELGRRLESRERLFEELRRAQLEASDQEAFRDTVRWPIVSALLDQAGAHLVTLENGLLFEITADSRIERAVLLSADRRPDHLWEPQTTRLVVALGTSPGDVIVGGAYIGDHALPIARSRQDRSIPGTVHAFEAMTVKYDQLVRNIDLNRASNVVARHNALWDVSDAELGLAGPAALASCGPPGPGAEAVVSITIDDYVRRERLPRVGLITLDIEGGEEKALAGAAAVLGRDPDEAPNVVLEVHRDYVDWSDGLENAPVLRLLGDLGYELYAIRDYQDNLGMRECPIEIIPADSVYLEGPPHGFNMLATKRLGLPEEHDLRVVRGVSPKLLLHRNDGRHEPVHS